MVRVIYSLFILTVALLVSSCGGGFGGVSSSLLENPKPDFSISLNPNTLSVQAGQSTNTTLTITPQFGFSGNVALSLNLTTKTLYRVAYINGYFVAMGQNGTILVCNANTSDCRQGASWSLKTSGTTQTLEWLIHDGQRYVMVGNGGTVLTSSDLNTWTNANANFGGDTPNLWGIAYINGRYVAVSNNNNKVYLSQDLSVWTSPYTAQQRLTFVLKVNDLLLATGDGGTILRSTDGGQSWTLANTGTSNKVNFVSDCESLLIAVGDGGTVLTSRR
ncbi:MAG: hypothetical protein KNN14_04935 [Aquificota bacterium]|nr:MAG: hypothetical protein KNN14_04935 [Aquificota bacterium]